MYSVSAQNQKNNCKRPPKMLSQPRFSDEDKAKWKGKTVSGKIAITVSEDGDVVQAGIVSSSPKEAAEALLDAAKRAKFQARSGCGELKTEVIFNLGR
jgi:TonB family protein